LAPREQKLPALTEPKSSPLLLSSRGGLLASGRFLSCQRLSVSPPLSPLAVSLFEATPGSASRNCVCLFRLFFCSSPWTRPHARKVRWPGISVGAQPVCSEGSQSRRLRGSTTCLLGRSKSRRL